MIPPPDPINPNVAEAGILTALHESRKNKPEPEPKPGKAHKTQPVKKDKGPRTITADGTAAHSKRREYERPREQRPERKEAHRQAQMKICQRTREQQR